jgi:hypothetical protein
MSKAFPNKIHKNFDMGANCGIGLLNKHPDPFFLKWREMSQNGGVSRCNGPGSARSARSSTCPCHEAERVQLSTAAFGGIDLGTEVRL